MYGDAIESEFASQPLAIHPPRAWPASRTLRLGNWGRLLLGR